MQFERIILGFMVLNVWLMYFIAATNAKQEQGRAARHVSFYSLAVRHLPMRWKIWFCASSVIALATGALIALRQPL